MAVQKKVLIVVPAFNEERAIGPLVRQLKSLYPHYMTLVINDGSTDDTSAKAAEAGAEVISLPYNLGIGGAVQTGLKFAFEDGYAAAVQIDGDGQHDPKFLSVVVKAVLDDKLDLCIGSRFLLGSHGFQSTAARRVGIRFFSLLLHLLTGLRLSDPTSGFRAYGKNLLKHYADYYPVDFPEPEAIMIAKRYGKRIGEVSVQMRKRLGGVSSIRYWKTIYYMFKVTLAILIDTIKRKK